MKYLIPISIQIPLSIWLTHLWQQCDAASLAMLSFRRVSHSSWQNLSRQFKLNEQSHFRSLQRCSTGFRSRLAGPLQDFHTKAIFKSQACVFLGVHFGFLSYWNVNRLPPAWDPEHVGECILYWLVSQIAEKYPHSIMLTPPLEGWI